MRIALLEEKIDSGFFEKVECNPEDSAKYLQMVKDGVELPYNIIKSRFGEGWNFHEIVTAPPDECFSDYLLYIQTKSISAIKKWVTFFGVLAVIGASATAVYLMILAAAWFNS